MRKGISLVALVITIIVLIILAAAVMLTGADTPDTAKVAVFSNDAGNIQDAVTLYRLNYMAANEGALPELTNPAKADITESTTASVTINGVKYYPFAADITAAELSLTGVDLTKWAVSVDGQVAHINGIKVADNSSDAAEGASIYYNVGMQSAATLTGSEWDATAYPAGE